MWQPFKIRTVSWNLSACGLVSSSASDMEKSAHELRLLNLLLPTILDVPPDLVEKRESPDFEVVTTTGSLFVEIVDAVPDAISVSGIMNLAKRRGRQNSTPYHVNDRQFGEVIASQIEAKRGKARRWLQADPKLGRRLVLLVNGGLAPMRLRDYFRDAVALRSHVAVAAIDPFAFVALGDETGAFVWES